MTATPKNIAVLGSTGSIGTSALDVIGGSQGRLRASGLSAHRRTSDLECQARQMQPDWIAVTDADAAKEHDWSSLPSGIERLTGQDSLEQAVRRDDVEIVLAAIVGSAGLRSTWAALDAGKTVALANKETLVMAGSLATELAAERGAAILPVDSEHCAIFQALEAGRRKDVKRIVLTASGGPFRTFSLEQMQHVTIEDALNHPTWDMGPKITIDSATMMNKALEIIEARWLFDMPAEKIDVVIHPQSIVHSMVEFVDGSVLAQMSPPDMKLPIQYAFSYPERWSGVADVVDWSQAFQLEFEPPDYERFGALRLGMEAASRGGTTGAVLNAANEAAVAAFLAGELAFTEIVAACRGVLEHHNFESNPSLETLLELDRWARKEITRWVCTS